MYQSVNVSSEEKRILQDLIIIRLHASQEKISKRRGANFYLREPRLQKRLTICEQLWIWTIVILILPLSNRSVSRMLVSNGNIDISSFLMYKKVSLQKRENLFSESYNLSKIYLTLLSVQIYYMMISFFSSKKTKK